MPQAHPAGIMKQLTLLEKLDDCAVAHGKAADRLEGFAASEEELVKRRSDIAYQKGVAIGYTESRKYADKELRRLCNLFQNGALTISDFGVHL